MLGSQSLGRAADVDTTDQAGLSAGHNPNVAMALKDEGTHYQDTLCHGAGPYPGRGAHGLNASAHAWVHNHTTVVAVGGDV